MSNYKGFSLIEVMIVISLIAILSTFSLSNYSQVQKQTRDSRRKTDLASVKSSLELYYSVNNKYPTSLTFGTTTAWSDTNGVYMKIVPGDPQSANPQYCFVSVSPNSTYSLYASLENYANDTDKNIITPATIPGCPAGTYNYKIESQF